MIVDLDALPVSPVPPDIAETTIAVLQTVADEDLRWRIERLAELAYHLGYADGHTRGWGSGAAHRHRGWVDPVTPPPSKTDI